MSFDKKRFNAEVNDWQRNNLEQKRYNYELKRNPVFFDLGAYKGEWSHHMVNKYGGHSYLFEIMDQYSKELNNKYKDDEKYKIFDFGLSGKTQTILTSLENITDGFSVFENNSSQKINIKLKCAKDFIEENNVKNIDIFKINIEGGEYDLLEHMTSEKITGLCDNIQIQFHWQYPIENFCERWLKIRERLSATHYLTYDYYFVWENWKLK